MVQPLRIYSSVGSDDLADAAYLSSQRTHVTSDQDVLDWARQTRQALTNGSVTATFIVDTSGALWIADRHSEHVACARGGDVLAAGEITFAVAGKTVRVSEVTNQSTGYCPEPES